LITFVIKHTQNKTYKFMKKTLSVLALFCVLFSQKTNAQLEKGNVLIGADLANLINEAALFAARANKVLVDMGDLEKAKDMWQESGAIHKTTLLRT